jgi:hypothetical protein
VTSIQMVYHLLEMKEQLLALVIPYLVQWYDHINKQIEVQCLVAFIHMEGDRSINCLGNLSVETRE